jgi:hypothetical protein
LAVVQTQPEDLKKKLLDKAEPHLSSHLFVKNVPKNCEAPLIEVVKFF